MSRSVHVEGFGHVAPIPDAARVGPLLVSSAIGGQQVGAAERLELAKQVDRVFDGIGRVAAAGGCALADIVRVTFTVRDRSARQAIDERWCEMFPAEDDRPARHVVVGSLPEGLLVQAEFIAYCPEEEP